MHLATRGGFRHRPTTSLSIWLGAALAACGLLSCSGDSTGPDSGGTVASIEVVPTSARIEVGEHVRLHATMRDAGGNEISGPRVFWDSEDPSVATVTDAGEVIGVARGAIRIGASAEGKSALADVTVVPRAVASVAVSPSTARLQVGETAHLAVEMRDADGNVLTGRAVSWQSDHTSVATVDTHGLVRAVGAGTAVITAESEDKHGTATVTVTEVPVASVSISPGTATVEEGGEQQFTAVARSAAGDVLSGRSITWTSDHENVAVVSSTGLAVGRATGVAHITAAVEGKSSTAVLTVTAPGVASVTVSPSSAELRTGESVQLTATLRDRQGNVLTGRSVAWTSSAPLVATVSPSGTVAALAAGSTTIKATSEGVSGSASITVKNAPSHPPHKSIGSVSVTPTHLKLHPRERRQLDATVKDTDGQPMDVPVEWQSSDTRVATVSADGTVTAVDHGKAKITASAGGKSSGADVDVNGHGQDDLAQD